MSNSYYPQPRPPLPPYQPVPTTPIHPDLQGGVYPFLTIMLTFLALSMLAMCILLTMGGTLFSFFVSHTLFAPLPPTSTPVPTLPPLKVYSVVGKPTINAQFINNVLEYYNSPASGKGQALYDDGVKSGINPAYALAFFLEESDFGTKGVATATHALGNIRANQEKRNIKDIVYIKPGKKVLQTGIS